MLLRDQVGNMNKISEPHAHRKVFLNTHYYQRYRKINGDYDEDYVKPSCARETCGDKVEKRNGYEKPADFFYS
jgi:hypothetical protein